MKKCRYSRFIVSAVLMLSFILVLTECHACTGIRIKTEDGNYIFARTLEFDTEFITHNLIAVPRNYKFSGNTPSGKLGMSWKTKYAYVGFSPSKLPIVDDGLNEKGLACGGFFLAGYAEYEDVTEKDYPRTISNLDLVSWVLGTCASVSEVREQLSKIRICTAVLPELGFPPPMHYLVADKTGDAMIIEYVGGKRYIYDNKVNAIANSPTYDWHTTNLRNYIALKPDNNPPIEINGNEFAQFGQGSGAIGLPGDFSSPSRFIRATFFANSAFQGKNVDEGIGIAFHVLNQFDIPKGSIRGTEAGKPVTDTTQWTSAADLTNCRYFYHTYNDRSVRMIDLKKLDLDAPNIKTIKDTQRPAKIEDVSGQFK